MKIRVVLFALSLLLPSVASARYVTPAQGYVEHRSLWLRNWLHYDVFHPVVAPVAQPPSLAPTHCWVPGTPGYWAPIQPQQAAPAVVAPPVTQPVNPPAPSN